MASTGRQRGREGPLLFLGIFLMFAPVGVLMMMVQETPQGWLGGLVSATFSGLLSVGWAYTFMRERWWLLIPLIVAPFVIPQVLFNQLARAGVLEIGTGIPPQARLIVLAAMCVAFTAFGFVLSVLHLRRTERASANAYAELDIAGRVHRTLVPPITLTTPLADVFGRSKPSSTMGGDLIDAVAEEGRVDVLIGDVSGHGVGAGIVMAMLKSCIRMRLMHHADLSEAIGDVNRVLADLTESGMFATFVALRVLPGRRVEFALAGHLPVFHFRAAQGRWERHPNQSLPLGIEHAEEFAAGATQAGAGDIFAVFTDGLTEVQDGAGRELGLEGVAALIQCASRSSLEALHATVAAGVSGHGAQLDDQSLVLVRVR
jgi:hypothetical protein